MTGRMAHSCAPEARSTDIRDNARARAGAIGEPSPELLDRALAGWERFLDGFEGADAA
ncbi:hypothetical protein ACFYZT_28305 [Streptomyces sp. NPDC001591]|uniref:hypothetical protein n=1 Tax=Streptomyces sp. NPDC001591 TaxID=3364589 RepID=UPI0036A2807B